MGGCATTSLEFPLGLRFSPLGSDPEGIAETEPLRGQVDPDCPMVAQEAMVPHPLELDHSSSSAFPSPERPSPSGSSLPSRPWLLQADGLALQRQTLQEKGCSEKVIDILLSSRKPVTKVWGVFSCWCLAKGTSQQEIPAILGFL